MGNYPNDEIITVTSKVYRFMLPGNFYPVLISNLRFLVNVVTILKITHKLREKGC